MKRLQGKRKAREVLTPDELQVILAQSDGMVDLGLAVDLTRNGQGTANEASRGRS